MRKKDLVELLVRRGANLELADDNGLRALHFACGNTPINQVALMLDKGAEINSLTNDGDTPLHFAANDGNLELVKLLVARGAKLDIKNKKGESVIESAAFAGRKETALYLIEQAAPKPPAKAAAAKGKKPAVKTTPPAKTVQSVKPAVPNVDIFVAAALGIVPRVQACLKADPSLLDKQNLNGTPLLHLAVRSGSQEMVAYLLSAGMAVDIKDNRGATALSDAVTANTTMVQVLLEKGADPNAQDQSGFAPLHRAATYAREETAALLLSKGADPNVKTKYGDTPLHELVAAGMAKLDGYLQLAQMLIDKGADVNAKTSRGESVLQQAKFWQLDEYIKLLQQHGAKE